MTNEKMLFLVNKAIECLADEDSKAMIDLMRETATKTADRASFGFTGAYLEELRCGLLADIEAAEAKKNGKTNVLSAMKYFNKEAYKKSIESSPYFAYAHYDENNNEYWLTNTYWLIVSEKSDGMTLIPEAVNTTVFNYKAHIADTSNYEAVDLPPLAKISTYLKTVKANKKHNSAWDRLVFEKFLINGSWLEQAMKLTGATQIMYKQYKPLILTGNGYTVAIMPVRPNDGEEPKPTDFDNI